jgi:hypothetical protein
VAFGCAGRWALILRTAWVVVRRTVRVSSLRSMVMVSAATWTVTTWPAWMRPRAIFCPAIMMTPVLLARRWAVTGSADGRGGGPAGRAPRSSRASSQVSGPDNLNGMVATVVEGSGGRPFFCLRRGLGLKDGPGSAGAASLNVRLGWGGWRVRANAGDDEHQGDEDSGNSGTPGLAPRTLLMRLGPTC